MTRDSLLLWMCGGDATLLIGCMLLLTMMVRLRRDLTYQSNHNTNATIACERLSQEQGRLAGEVARLQEELVRTRGERDQRVLLRSAVYRLATVGMRGCGKSDLTFRCWASPLYKGELEQTQFARYKKTISRTIGHSAVDHVVEILDWGGELLNEAQAALVKQEVHALLMVVDLGEPGHEVFSEERVRAQIKLFNQYVLLFFFSPDITRKCQTVVLFINKCDLLSGYPGEVDERARALYKPLIDTLLEFGEKHGVSIEVFVGSAKTGMRVNRLFAHIIERVLPPEGFDDELRATLESVKRTETQSVPLLPLRRSDLV